MQRGVCKVVLVGNAGEDGLVRYTPAGKAVLRISLATGDDRHGGAKPSTDWHRIVIAGAQAEDRANAVLKGSLCYVEGTLRTRSDQTAGASRRITEVVVDADGTFRVYHDDPPNELTAPVALGLDNRTEVAVLPCQYRSSVNASDTPPPQLGKPASSVMDDEWLSFEGLTLNNHADSFE